MLNRKPKREGYLPLSSAPQPVPAVQAQSRFPSLGKRTSPSTESRRSSTGTIRTALANPQPQPVRQKDKFVPLPDGKAPAEKTEASITIFEDLEADDEPARGRITVYCIAEALERKALEAILRSAFNAPTLHVYPEVVHMEAPGANGKPGDVFFFDYGCICLWGLTQSQEKEIVKLTATHSGQEPLPARDVEIDLFQFHYSAHEPPHMQNDTITVNRRQAADHQVKLAISHALAQSTKLCVYEQRVQDVVMETKRLPEALAVHGTVHISRKQVAQLIGKLFLQRSAVNLLSSVLDTPEFFWSAPDQLQGLYERVCEYLELETRVEVLNSRFAVLQEMLDMLRDHQNNFHTARLEWIIIWLIAVELVVGLFQLLGLFGWVGRHSQ